MEKKALSIHIHIFKLNINFLFSRLNNEDTGDKRKEKLVLVFFF